MVDERLLGRWQSDAEHTLAELRQHQMINDQQEEVYRRIFGKMKITYRPDVYATEFDGSNTTIKYEVLGKDDHSVVIRDLDRAPSLQDQHYLPSSFAVLHFVGPDLYWIYIDLVVMREFFRRVE